MFSDSAGRQSVQSIQKRDLLVSKGWLQAVAVVFLTIGEVTGGAATWFVAHEGGA